MMNYEIFKETIKNRFVEFLPEEYENSEIIIDKVNKVNITMDALIIKPFKTDNVCPTLYINEMYEDYKFTKNIEDVLQRAAKVFMDSICKKDFVIDRFKDVEYIKNNIFFQFINTKLNKNILDDVPHREFLDLSIIYRVVINSNKDKKEIASTIIHNELMKVIGLSEEQLFEYASKNTDRLFPSTIKSITSIFGMEDDSPIDEQMIIISNELCINGAINMIYEKNLKSIAEKMNSDLYILPSSVHEVIVVSTKIGDPTYLIRTISEVNSTELSKTDILSDQLYMYDKEFNRVISVANNSNIYKPESLLK